jgi:hypothetical protein
MTCPICAFPGNDDAAIRCSNCGFSMRPAPANPDAIGEAGPPVVAAYEAHPIPGPLPLPPQHAAWPPISWSPIPDPPGAAAAGQPVSGPPAGIPGSGPPVVLSPAPGPPPGLIATPRRSRLVTPLAVLVVVVVIAGAVIAVARMTGETRFTPAATGSNARAGWTTRPGLPAGPASPPAGSVSPPAGPASPAVAASGPRADPGAQAAAMDAVLDASAASRARLNAAISRVSACASIEQAISDLRTVGTERQAQLDSAAALGLSTVPEGEQLRALLSEALRFSLAADRSFVSWAQARQGCDGGGRTHYREAQRQSSLAGDAKARFLTVWNPVAVRHGLRERSSTDI